MLEVRKAATAELAHLASTSSAVDALEDAFAGTRSFHNAVTAATSPKVLHAALSKRRKSNTETERYRVDPNCDEDGKSFISIEVLPHFL